MALWFSRYAEVHNVNFNQVNFSANKLQKGGVKKSGAFWLSEIPPY